MSDRKKARAALRAANRETRRAEKAEARTAHRAGRRQRIRLVGRRPGDTAAAVVHITGAAFALAAVPILLVRASASRRGDLIVGFALYGASLLYYFVISAVAHLLESEGGRRVLGTLDIAGSFFLIAGSWTPLCLSVFKGPSGWLLFGLLWGFAILDFLASIFYIGRLKDLALGVYYLAFTLIVPLIEPFRSLLGPLVFAWLILAGALYALGLLFEARDSMPYHHSIWHSFTLVASVCHFFGLLGLVL
jgi:hemolysin III